jgi:protein-disulfide isomerase
VTLGAAARGTLAGVSTTFSRTCIVAALAASLGCGQSDPSIPSSLEVPLGDSPQRGPSDAWVTIVEFADFECPYCRLEEPILQDVESTYGADLRVVFKYLLAGHAHSEAAAVAAECAGEQGKFWEMHDLLFETDLDDSALLADARRVPGLDANEWQACLGTPEAASRVAADVDLATSLGVPATPTLSVNGVAIVGAASEDDLNAAVDHARDVAVASGIPRAEYYDKAVLGH